VGEASLFCYRVQGTEFVRHRIPPPPAKRNYFRHRKPPPPAKRENFPGTVYLLHQRREGMSCKRRLLSRVEILWVRETSQRGNRQDSVRYSIAYKIQGGDALGAGNVSKEDSVRNSIAYKIQGGDALGA
jgi:hypothetical protein